MHPRRPVITADRPKISRRPLSKLPLPQASRISIARRVSLAASARLRALSVAFTHRGRMTAVLLPAFLGAGIIVAVAFGGPLTWLTGQLLQPRQIDPDLRHRDGPSGARTDLFRPVQLGPLHIFQAEWISWPVDRFARVPGGKLAERAPGPATATVGDRLSFHPPFGAFDSRTFGAGQWTIALVGVEGPGRDAVCFSSDGAPFACGLHARAALTNVLAQTSLDCQLASAPKGDLVEGQCLSARGDVATLMASLGWVRPVGGVEDDSPVSVAARAARAARVGMWGGEWRYRPAGR